ncbi:response regulator [Winogradskyella sp.]|nr:response regulator [Winogradskyella sp.]
MSFFLLDDDFTFNFIHRKKIEKFGIDQEIVEFTSPTKAILYFMDANEDQIPDILLLDINMPELNGFEFLDALMAKRTDLCDKLNVFIVTSSLNPEDYQTAKGYDCIKGFHNKPIDLDNIMTTSSWLLNQKTKVKIK